MAAEHVVIDLETMGNGDNAAIVSIGAYRFNPTGPLAQRPDMPGAELESFYRVVDLGSSVKAGLSMSPDTIMWWLRQSQEARDALLVKDAMPLAPAMAGLGLFIRDTAEKPFVWGHGATFDPVIVKNAFRACGMEVPFDFRNVRDTRTLFDVVGENLVLMPQAQKHNALWDAWREAVAIQECYALQRARSRVLHI